VNLLCVGKRIETGVPAEEDRRAVLQDGECRVLVW
jgi:hypothetical protein